MKDILGRHIAVGYIIAVAKPKSRLAIGEVLRVTDTRVQYDVQQLGTYICTSSHKDWAYPSEVVVLHAKQ
jgi:hypothetical protein